MEKIYRQSLHRTAAVLPKPTSGTLAGVLCKLPKFHDEHLLVGTETSDDAAVHKISGRIWQRSRLLIFYTGGR